MKRILETGVLTTGAFVVPRRLESGKWGWVVTSFEDDTYFLGDLCNSVKATPAEKIGQLFKIQDIYAFTDLFGLEKYSNNPAGKNKYLFGPAKKEYVQSLIKKDPLRIWTLVKINKEYSIRCGMLLEDVIGYLITTEERIDDSFKPIPCTVTELFDKEIL